MKKASFKGEVGSQRSVVVYKTVNGEKIESLQYDHRKRSKLLWQKIVVDHDWRPKEEVAFEEIPFKTVTEQDATWAKELKGFQAGKNGKKKKSPRSTRPSGGVKRRMPQRFEEVVEQLKIGSFKRDQGTWQANLTLNQVDKEELKRSAKATYRLTNHGGTIKSIQAVLKKVIKLWKSRAFRDGLAAALADLDYYKRLYVITTMVWRPWKWDEGEVLKEEPLRIDLKSWKSITSRKPVRLVWWPRSEQIAASCLNIH